MDLNLKYTKFPRNDNITPEYIMILLHGYGSNKQDLITLAPDFAEDSSNMLFISPDAPFQFEGGMSNAYQWYSLADRSTNAMMHGYNHAQPILEKFVQSVSSKYNVPYEKIIISGFSQGGMMSLHYGLTSQHKFAAVLSFSGYMVGHDGLAEEIQSTPPVFISHGGFDMVVPIQAHEMTLKMLKKFHVEAEDCVSPGLGHGIDHVCINSAKKFLKKTIV